MDKSFWSHAAQDTVNKANYLATRRADGVLVPPSYNFFPAGSSPSYFQVFGKQGFIVKTRPSALKCRIKQQLCDISGPSPPRSTFS